jgi:hypothetical protein
LAALLNCRLLTTTIRQYVASDMPPLVMLRLPTPSRNPDGRAQVLTASRQVRHYRRPEILGADKEGTKAIVRDLFSASGGKVSGTLPA